MAGVAEIGAYPGYTGGAETRLSEWRIRPRQLGSLLVLRWKLGTRMFRRSVSAVIGLIATMVFTLFMAASVGGLSALGYLNTPRAAAAQILFAVLALLYLVWAGLPVLQYSVNEGLDVTKLHTYPITRAERMAALTISTFFDPPSIVILAAFVAVLIGWHTSALAILLTVIGFALLYVHIVGLSQFTLAALVGMLRSRRYRDISIVVFALMSVLCSLSGQFGVAIAARIGGSGHTLADLNLGAYLQWIPPGMAAQAIIHANAGDTVGSVLWLAPLLALTPLLIGAWAWVLDRGITAPEGESSVARPRRLRIFAPEPEAPAVAVSGDGQSVSARRFSLISPVVSAIAVKDLRFFWRDPQLKASLLSSLVLLLVVFAPNLTSHRQTMARDYFSQHLAGYQPLLAPLPALLIVLTLSLNSLGLERQGLQMLMLTPARPRDILWGKNLAVAIVAFSAQVVLITAQAALTNNWHTAPLALVEGIAATMTLLGAGNITSVLAPLRVRQLRMGANNISSENGCLRAVISLVALTGTLILLTPVFVLLLFPPLIERPQWLLFSAPVALIYGIALYQFATLLIAPRLLSRAPEILAVVARDA